ncbi:hypothetical protein C475_09012 [Halosimplex carlsbadense 2-9-1]|uniref:Uncharacterized protein n=1 Tax=Halosimplex carlsbadense 2-9-1 TaxID=797114 RepID=M0CXF8_9EURY|nr:hypothetical protein [Halosimplex carlsbadense]ELZ26554.1 hypothetical protein C475_09012 [Halosimplex carlsbadense 2-9-1]
MQALDRLRDHPRSQIDREPPKTEFVEVSCILLREALEHGIVKRVLFCPVPHSQYVIGAFYPDSRELYFDPHLAVGSWDAAATMTHELGHAIDRWTGCSISDNHSGETSELFKREDTANLYAVMADPEYQRQHPEQVRWFCDLLDEHGVPDVLQPDYAIPATARVENR